MHVVISVVHSLPAPASLALHLAGQFDIGPVEDCRLWRSFINDVYRLEAGGRAWWLRIHPFGWRTPAETQAEVEAILAISGAGGSVASPMPARDGGYLVDIPMPEGVRTAVLFEDAPGADLNYYGPDSLENARRYGVAVASLHLACDVVRESDARKPFDLNAVVIQPSIEVARHIRPEDRPSFARLTDALAGLLSGRDDLAVGFCHGDLNNANVHFQGDSATAFDFDCCAWGWRAFELAAFARGVTWHGGPDEATDKLIRTFFTGYQSIRTLSSADLEVQPAMLLAERLWVTSLHLKATYRLGFLQLRRGVHGTIHEVAARLGRAPSGTVGLQVSLDIWRERPLSRMAGADMLGFAAFDPKRPNSRGRVKNARDCHADGHAPVHLCAANAASPTPAAETDGLAPWHFHMTPQEVMAFADYGPYRSFSNGDLETFTGLFDGKKENVQFFFKVESWRGSASISTKARTSGRPRTHGREPM